MSRQFYGLLKFFFASSTLFLVYMVISPFDKQEIAQSKTIQEDGSEELLEIYDSTSLDDSESGLTNLFAKNFFEENEESLKSDCQKHIDHLSRLLENYIQRYINLFLQKSQLLNYEAKESEEVIEAALEVKLTFDELSFLQNYGKLRKFPLSPTTLQRDLSKLDAVLSKMIHVKKVHYFKLHYDTFLFYFNKCLYACSLINQQIVIFILVIFFSYKLFPSVSVNKFIIALFCAINSLILYEGYSVYVKRVLDAEINNIQILEKKIAACDPSKYSWYNKIAAIFWEEPCALYHRQQMNSFEEVSILQSVIDIYAFYCIEKPFQIFGKVSHNLAMQFTAGLPYFFRGFFATGFAGIIAIFLGLTVLLVCGMNFKLNFWGTSFRLYKDKKQQKPLLLEESTTANLQSAQKSLTS